MLEPKVVFESKDRGEKAILDQISRIGNGASVTVGYHFPEALEKPDGRTPIAAYAAYNEFPSGRVGHVARPTLGPMFERRQDQFYNQTVTHIRKLYSSRGLGISLEQILQIQGERLAKWLRQAVRELRTPPNAPSTLRRKKRRGQGSSPLLATRSMYKAIGFRVHMSKSINMRLASTFERIEKELRGIKW
jgi:hypothetical protein